MITAKAAALLCQELYVTQASWDHLWVGDDVMVALRHMPKTAELPLGQDAVIYRGSKTTLDWLRDFEALPKYDPEAGWCHAGFLAGLDESLAEVLPNLQGPVTFIGHSLGAARATIACIKAIVRGFNVVDLDVFGRPRPGFANLGRVLVKSGIRHRSWRNGNDPVTQVPFPLPFFPWEDPDVPGIFWVHADGEDLHPERDHNIALYAAGAPET